MVAQYIFSVLEQFDITKIYFSWSLPFLGILPIQYIFNFFFNTKIVLVYNWFKVCFFNFYNYKIVGQFLLFFKNIFQIIQSFFVPTGYFTKNYTYGRIAYFGLRVFLNLFIKKKILMFWRFNSLVVKIKIQLIFQQAIKTNFGDHYPYFTRLLNYYPYLAMVFFLILIHNFNGLLFYGFTNTAFLLQNFVISFQSVVGLTILEFLLGLMIFIKCLYHLMYLFYYYLF